MLAKFPEVLNFEADVIDSGPESGLSWGTGITKTQIGARHVRCRGDCAPRTDFQIKNFHIPFQQTFIVLREVVDVIAGEFFMQALILLKFDIDTVRECDVGVGLTFGTGEYTAHF